MTTRKISPTQILPGSTYGLAYFARQEHPQARGVLARYGLATFSVEEAEVLIWGFVEYLIRCDRRLLKAGRRIGDQPTVETTRLGKALFNVLPVLGLFRSDRSYSAKTYLFLDACWSIEKVACVDFLWMAENPQAAIETHRDELEALIEKMRASLQSQWFWDYLRPLP